MAVVKNPLWSLNATGMIGKTIAYVHQFAPLIIKGDRPGYQRRVIHVLAPGRGIVRKAPVRRLYQSGKTAAGRANPQLKNIQRLADIRAMMTVVIAWMVKYRINVSFNPPQPTSKYFGYGEEWIFNLMFRYTMKKPHEFAKGKTLRIFKGWQRAKTPEAHLWRTLVTKNYVGFNLSEGLYNSLTPATRALWEFTGNAPWSELPASFRNRNGTDWTRAFVSWLILVRIESARFQLNKFWYLNPALRGVYEGNANYGPGDFAYDRWLRALDEDTQNKEVNTWRWRSY